MRRAFDWGSVETTFDWHRTGRINMAHECIDRWALGDRKNKLALIYTDGQKVEIVALKTQVEALKLRLEANGNELQALYECRGAEQVEFKTRVDELTVAAQKAESVLSAREADLAKLSDEFNAQAILSEAQKARIVTLDATAPTLTGTATTAPNAAGWYKGDVTVHWTATDATSGVASTPADSVIGGEYEQEFRALQVPVKERGRRTNEMIPLIRALWTATEITHEGRYYPMAGVKIRTRQAAP